MTRAQVAKKRAEAPLFDWGAYRDWRKALETRDRCRKARQYIGSADCRVKEAMTAMLREELEGQ